MNDDCKRLLNKYTLRPNKITIKNKTKIIESDDGCFVFKKKSNYDLSRTYQYLKSRSFDYFPDIAVFDDEYDIYKYVDNIDEPVEQKATDIMYFLSLLHNKTTFYKEVDIDDYKLIYESISDNIEDLNNYYNKLIDEIDNKIYMSPSEYLIARNISKIFFALRYCDDRLKEWYELIKEKRNMRVVNIHNNMDINHYIKAHDKSYFISWEKSKIDMPIMDIYKFYKNHYLDFDFIDLFKVYESKYPLYNEEKVLLSVLIAIPDVIELKSNEYDNCKMARNIIDYLYKTEELLAEYNKPKTVN